jgi:hypothetical protein
MRLAVIMLIGTMAAPCQPEDRRPPADSALRARAQRMCAPGDTTIKDPKVKAMLCGDTLAHARPPEPGMRDDAHRR